MDHHSTASARRILINTARNVLREARLESSVLSFTNPRERTYAQGQFGLACVALVFLCLSALFQPGISSPSYWSAVAATFLLAIAASFLYVRANREASQKKELITRLASIIDHFETDIERFEELDSHTREMFQHGSALVSVYPVYRDEAWQRAPALLLVEGDLIALSAGDPTPGASVLLESSPSDDDEKERLERGSKAPERSRQQQHPPGVDSDQALLSLCGDTRIYRLQETPFTFFMEEALTTAGEFPRAPLTQLHVNKLIEVLTTSQGVVLAVVFLAGFIRMLVLGQTEMWAFYLLVQPSIAMLILLFPTLSVFLFFVEALATAQLLSFVGSLSSEGKARAEPQKDFKAATRSFVINLSRVLSQRLGMRWAERIFSVELSNYLHVPLRALRLVERLGCATEVCIVDDLVVCEPFTVPKEIFFKEDSTARGTILGLYQSSGNTHFESPMWWKNMPSLKPMGLASSITSSNDSTRESRPSLAEHLKRIPVRADALKRLASEIGFVSTDFHGFHEKLRVNVVAPTLFDMQAQYAQSQQESWQRGSIHADIEAAVVEDVRSGALQLLARGDPRAVLGCCTDFWDGKNISPLGNEGRKAILETSQQWSLEDRSGVALCYSPIPVSQEHVFRQRLGTGAMLLYGEHSLEATSPPLAAAPGEPRSSRDTSSRERNLETEGTGAVRALLRQQVFLGMVALRVPLRDNTQAQIQHFFEAGVRFIFFSPRNMRRSKALADAMGLETDWNCAISLKAVEDSAAPTWSVNAQMPFGVEAIRQHLEEGVDNVPLLVSMFTDSTPDAVKDTIQMFEEYAETVVCMGTSFRSTNTAIFGASDVGISVSCLPGGQQLASVPPTRMPDVLLNERLVSLQCALVVPELHSLNYSMSLIREGRRLLCNIYQLVHFSLAVSGTLGAVVVLATVAPVSSPPSISSGNILFIELALTCFVGFPMLASAINPSQLKQPQAKNEISLKWKEEVGRFLSYFAMRTLPTAIVCVFIYIWAFGEFLVKYDSSDVASCHTSQDQMEWYHITWCAGVESGRNLSHVKIAHQKAEALMVFSLVLALGVQSAGFLQRTASLVAFTPLSNQLWFAGMLFTVVLQLLFSLAQAGVISSTGPSKWTPWQLWLVVVTWPFISLGIGERVKGWDAAHHKLDLKYLELEFNTKLGQFSPR